MNAENMRLLSTILSAVSLVLLLFVGFYYARSYARYEGILHFAEGAPTTVTASKNGNTVEVDVTGRSTGWISFRGQLTYVSIANPVSFESWTGWSEPADAPPAIGPMLLVAEARSYRGLQGGSAMSQHELRDPIGRVAWRLPYRYVTMPFWVLVILLAILPYRWITGYLRAMRWEREGRCVGCGADVKGLTGNCPKCREPIG
jgi:hypothetical protein